LISNNVDNKGVISQMSNPNEVGMLLPLMTSPSNQLENGDGILPLQEKSATF